MDNDREVRRLAMIAAGLVQIFSEMWEAYESLFQSLDMNDPTVVERTLDAVIELEHNLTDVLDQISGQLFVLTGIHEPLPTDVKGDFEAAVLRDLDKLGEIDLDEHRVPDIVHTGDDPDSVVQSDRWDDLEHLTKEELIDRVQDMRSILDELEDWNE